jgi:UDP-N-acetylmuramate dehydrogenase
MDLEKIAADLRPNLKGKLLLQEPMKNHTTWKVGGIADLLITAKSKSDIAITLKYANENRVPCCILGNGSNVLVLDQGIRGIALKLAGGLNQVTVQGQKVIAEAGARLPALAKTTYKHGLSGLEFLAAIPGTIGGALIMNAGAYGASIGKLVEKVVSFNMQGEILEFDANQLNFGYRQSSLAQNNVIVIEAELFLKNDEPALIKARMEQFQKHRMENQPLNLPNAGSIFINPPGYAAGYLIEKAGAKGLRKGGAKVSEKHANFIVNVDNASAQDILELIACVKEKVYQTFNIQLETEIKLLGEG